MSKQISLVYRTDEAVGGYGFAVDDIRLESDGNLVYSDDAETALETVVLSGFVRTDDTRPGAPRRYLLQLRNYQALMPDCSRIAMSRGSWFGMKTWPTATTRWLSILDTASLGW